MMMKSRVVAIVLFLYSVHVFSQSEGLTSSPYSLYGLGVINQTSIGISNGLGYTGIGMKLNTGINNLNAANYAMVPKNSFFYDVGVRAKNNTYANNSNSESKTSLNFSNLAFAFAIDEGWGMGLTLVPYSDVGYSIVGLTSNVEGSTDTFESSVTGVGGLNDLRIQMGYEALKGLRAGVSLSFLFGSIEEDETFIVNSSAFELSETTSYKGVQLGFGMQYDLTDNITLGSTLKLPTTMGGTLKRSATKYFDSNSVEVEDNEDDEVSDFKMPMELGVGISGKFLNSFLVNVDYKKNFWSSTNQSEHIGSYVDQDIYGLGVEYLNNPQGNKYWERMRFRGGFNYDSGYLSINNKEISGKSVTAGIGFPIRRGSNSLLNLSYAYGSSGVVQNILIKENYHLVTLNLSLEDLWFMKRKIN